MSPANHSYVSEVELGQRPPFDTRYWSAIVKLLPGTTIAELQRAAAQTRPLEIDLSKATTAQADLALAVALRLRDGSLDDTEAAALLDQLRGAAVPPGSADPREKFVYDFGGGGRRSGSACIRPSRIRRCLWWWTGSTSTARSRALSTLRTCPTSCGRKAAGSCRRCSQRMSVRSSSLPSTSSPRPKASSTIAATSSLWWTRPIAPRKESWVKISQIRTLSSERIGRRLGEASPEELNRVLEGLHEIIGS